MDVIFALVLSLHGHAALLDRVGPFDTVEACRTYARAQNTVVGCLPAAQLDAATRQIFGIPANEIWK